MERAVLSPAFDVGSGRTTGPDSFCGAILQDQLPLRIADDDPVGTVVENGAKESSILRRDGPQPLDLAL